MTDKQEKVIMLNVGVQQKVQGGMSAHQSLRSACISRLPDQSLRWALYQVAKGPTFCQGEKLRLMVLELF